MRGLMILYVYVPLLFGLVDASNTLDETFFDRFFGSPLLVLSAIIIILIGASILRKMRK